MSLYQRVATVDAVQAASRYGKETTVHAVEVDASCRLRVPPQCENGYTVTLQEYRRWEEGS